MKTFETTDSRTIDRSAAELLDRITAPATWPEWQPEILRTDGPSHVGAGDVVSGNASMLGFEVAGRATIDHVDERTVEHDVIVGIRMRVSYDVTRGDNGTTVTHRLSTELPSGLLGRMLSVFLKPRLRAMQRELLDNLASGAGVSVKRAPADSLA